MWTCWATATASTTQRTWAVDVEGYPDVLVHGPCNGTKARGEH
jgi:hypothetical protein